MNTNDIREIIKKKIFEENQTNKLKNQIAASAGKKAAANTIEFIENYVRMTPELIDTVYTVAKQHNLLKQFQPIFDGVFNYWLQEYDFIPDNLGLVGICDDAYLSLSLMHMIANTKVPGSGRLLLEKLDLREMNNNMKIILGPNISSQLDATVNATYQSVNIQNSLSALIIKLLARGMSMGIQNMYDQYKIDEEVRTRLGAMGIF